MIGFWCHPASGPVPEFDEHGCLGAAGKTQAAGPPPGAERPAKGAAGFPGTDAGCKGERRPAPAKI
jgi:hypothetical protein